MKMEQKQQLLWEDMILQIVGETPVQTYENWQEKVTIIWNNDTQFIEEYDKNGEGGRAKNLKDFTEKATSNNGFYIGRYEVGQDANGNITCVSGVGAYTFVPNSPIQSPKLKNMYNTSKYDSDLINSYAWDTALLFIQKFSGDEDYATQNVVSSERKNCGETGDEKCNINDMSGNYLEWTTEASNGKNYIGYTYRGKEKAYDRNAVRSSSVSYVGASGRVIIYL